MVFSFGNSFTTSFQMEVPPMPESNMPIGSLFIRVKKSLLKIVNIKFEEYPFVFDCPFWAFYEDKGKKNPAKAGLIF